MNSLLVILFVIIDTRFVDYTFVKNWAEAVIEKVASPQSWLFDLADCIDLNKMQDMLRSKIYDEGVFFDDHYQRLCLGFLFLRYENDGISYLDLEGEVVGVIDACNGIGGVDVEYIQKHFASKKNVSDPNTIFGRLMKSCAEEARLGIAYISSEKMLINECRLISN